ncbi:MAG TPA: anti-sigma factor [Burkholderiales bacterium]|nr:anti-sigma factor [Burkholderiales bacterium]
MATAPGVTREDLIRYADGRLAPERRAQVAAYLHEHPEMAEELQAQQRLGALLREGYRRVREEPVPQALLEAAARNSGHLSPARGQSLRTAAIAAATALVAGAAGWLIGSATVEPRWQEFTGQAAAAYRVYGPERDRPVEIAAREELLAWLSRRLGMPVLAPQLDDFGFRFVGGRLLPTAGGAPAAQLLYENEAGRRLTLYIRSDLRNMREIEFQLARQGGVNVLYWLDGPRGYALVSDLEESAMLPLAKGVYDAFRS